LAWCDYAAEIVVVGEQMGLLESATAAQAALRSTQGDVVVELTI
jgi:hypothetical protein